MFSLTGNTRYLVRELIPRTVVFFLCTYLIMPHAPGLAFHGGPFAAACAALFFTAYFSLWGAHIMALPRVQSFIGSLKGPVATGAFHTTMMITIPLLALVFLELVAEQTFVLSAWWGYLIWIIVLHACCLATHDYTAP